MRRLIVTVVAAAALSGCGADPPPDAATSETMIRQVVTDFHQLWSQSRGAEACELMTERAVERMESDEGMRKAIPDFPDECADAIAFMARSPQLVEAERTTVVDSVAVRGERADVVIHSTMTTSTGEPVTMGPVTVKAAWEDGRWKVD